MTPGPPDTERSLEGGEAARGGRGLLRWRAVLLALTLSLLLAAPPATAAEQRRQRYQRAVGFLQHISGEYLEAIEEGELNSLKDQAALVREGAEGLRDAGAEGKAWAAQLEALAQRMPAERTAPKSRAQMDALISKLTAAGRLVTHPRAPPELARGAALYASSCAACHGTPADPQPRIAQFMYPMPSSFLRADVMTGLSPFAVFNIVSHGLPGSTMPSYELLSEEDRWAIAFYLFTQREPACEGPAPSVGLEVLARRTDHELIRQYGRGVLGCLRGLRAPPSEGTATAVP